MLRTISKVKILTGQLEQEKKLNDNLRHRLDELIEDQSNENDRKIKRKFYEVRSNDTSLKPGVIFFL